MAATSSSLLLYQIRKRGKIRLPTTTTTARWSTLEESTTSLISTAEPFEEPLLVEDLDGRIVLSPQANVTLLDIDIMSAVYINDRHDATSVIEGEDGGTNTDVTENSTSAVCNSWGGMSLYW